MQSPQSPTHQDAREILAAESERIQRLQAQQAIEREAELEMRRAVAAEERRRQEEIEAERQETHKLEYERQQHSRRNMKRKQEEQQRETQERAPTAAVAKQKPVDLKRGNSIRHKLASLSRQKSTELLGLDKIQKLPEKKNLSENRRLREKISKARPNPDAPVSRLATSNNVGPGAWVDAPISKPAEQPIDVGPAQWVDAPISRPTPPDEGPVVLPQYDAPVSAVNAGERRVQVKYNDSSITLPVTPTTTPKDLISSVSTVMPDSPDPRRSKLVESFTQLGLERPLRNYEHVRDVMNSWDNDVQNTLVIQPLAHDEQDEKLDSKHVPKHQPEETAVYMYHSQRPGTWDKRWIMLRSDGQMAIAKRRGQETTNICHLTDFDIYLPTHRQRTKKIKPPKKICFAVKSQQKSNMFLNGANFVHFFATNDKGVAEEWYRAVQTWRSWYLVNILGEGHNSKNEPTTNDPTRPTTARSQRRASIDASPYRLGSFQPLVDSDKPKFNDSTPAPRAAKSAEVFHARKMSSRDRALPPSAFYNKLSKGPESGAPTTNQARLPSMVKGPTPGEMETATFAPTGLLGRTYSQRQKAQKEREANERRNNTLQATDHPTGLTRKASTKSVRHLPRPLIDLTPQYQEPPQHVKKGRGVSAEPGQQLVEAATGLELQPGAIVTPSARAWRRPQGQSPPLESSSRPRRQSIDGGRRKMSIDGGRPGPVMDGGRPQFKGTEAFVEGGLLARTSSRRAQGGAATGHGVKTGDRNAIGKPMIDLQMKSQFADGSLLRQVETHTGGDGPVIDRGKEA
jgi:PH domain